MGKYIGLIVVASFISACSFAQLGKVPVAVTAAFEKQYPTAQKVEYKDMLTSLHVHFVMDSAKMVAKYNGKGEWKETEKEWRYDSLAAEVQDGFQKSKYAEGSEWKVKETTIIYLPGGSEQYRIKVEKNDLQKKYLFFDKKGRLLRDALTI